MKAWKILFVMILLASPAMAQETKADPKAKVEVKAEATAKPAVTPSVTPASQPATVAMPVIPGEPLTPAEAVDAAKKGIEFAKARNWLGLSSIAILILVFLLKLTKVFEKIGRRWLYIIVPGLGVVAMLLAGFVGGVSWNAAWLVLTSAPCAALFSDLIKRGILGQEPVNTIKAGGG